MIPSCIEIHRFTSCLSCDHYISGSRYRQKISSCRGVFPRRRLWRDQRSRWKAGILPEGHEHAVWRWMPCNFTDFCSPVIRMISDVSKIKVALSRFVQQLSVYSSLNGEWRSCQEFPSRMRHGQVPLRVRRTAHWGWTQGPSSQSLARPGGTLRVARAIEAQGPAVVCFFLLGVLFQMQQW